MPRAKAKPTAAKAAKPKASRGPKAHKLAPSLPDGELLRDTLKRQWRVGKGIGQGGFGLIYLASDDISKPVDNSAAYVVKVEPLSNGPLFCEMHAYQRIGKTETVTNWIKDRKLKYLGMPKYIAAGNHVKESMEYRFLIMPRFGTDLQKLFVNAGKRFSQTSVLALGIRLLDVLEYMHDNEYVHADIKASNLLLGYQAGKTLTNQVYLVDFGLAYRYTVNDKHKEYKEDPRVAHDGTIEFTSCDAHKGVSVSRRGDLEILGYCLLQWLCGRLPWENKLSDKNYVRDEKIRYQKNIPLLMKECFPTTTHPDYMQTYLTHVNKLGYTERPDYNKCRDIFRRSLHKLGQKNEWTLDLLDTPSPRKGVKHTLCTANGATPAKHRFTNGDSDSPQKSPKRATSARSKPVPKERNLKTSKAASKSTGAATVSASKGKSSSLTPKGKSPKLSKEALANKPNIPGTARTASVNQNEWTLDLLLDTPSPRKGVKRSSSPANGATPAKHRFTNGDSESPQKSPKRATSARSKTVPKERNLKTSKAAKKSTGTTNVSASKGKSSSLTPKGKSPKLSKEALVNKLNIPGTARTAPVNQRLKAKVSSPKAASGSKPYKQRKRADMSVQTSPGVLKRR